MNLKTKSGISVTINTEGSSKILCFDKVTRAIELSKDEARRMSTILTMDVKVGITAELRKLEIEGFFKMPKSFKEIKKALIENGVEAKSASLNMILKKMTERKELQRTGTPRSYLYFAYEK